MSWIRYFLDGNQSPTAVPLVYRWFRGTLQDLKEGGMSVFISYAHEDKQFVETLGANLFKRNFHIFIDRWELKVGDSLLDHIQSELKDCSFICCVLSKASISSEWCRREINAGLM